MLIHQHFNVLFNNILTFRKTLDLRKVAYGPEVYKLYPKQLIHRVENQTEETAQLVEVQVGDYLGEDDIVRLEDVYGRE